MKISINDVIGFVEGCDEEDLHEVRKVAARRIRNINQERKAKAIVAEFSPFAMEMALVIENHYRLLFPNHPKTNLEKSARAIDLLERIDKQSRETIEKGIEWAFQDSFWQNNIRSGEKLRKHFPTMQSQARNQAMSKKGKVVVV